MTGLGRGSLFVCFFVFGRLAVCELYVSCLLSLFLGLDPLEVSLSLSLYPPFFCVCVYN